MTSLDSALLKLNAEERADLKQLVGGFDRKSFEELGRTGTVFFNGLVGSTEYNPDLRGDRAIAAYDRMWRSDGQVRAIVTVCELPLIEATWYIKPASDSPLDVEVAQFIQDNLIGGGMNRPWYETLKHQLTMFRYGFAGSEKVYAYDEAENKIKLRKLAPRLARTIVRIFPNDNDEVDHVQQVVWVNADDGSGGEYRYVDIPGARLLWVILDREGNDFFGNSLLRPAYQHWYFKTTLYKIDAIGCERQSMGVPYMVEPPDTNITEAQRAITRAALSSLHAHEKQFMLVPGGYQFGIAGVTGQTKAVLPSIEHHDLQMSRSVLAQFLNLDGGGSYALSKDGTSFFLQALKARGKIICEAFNTQVIRELVDLNFKVDKYPTLDFEDLDTRSVNDLLLPLAHLMTAGGLTANTETENTIRRMLNFPDLPEDTPDNPLDPTTPATPTAVTQDGQSKDTQSSTDATPDDGSASLSDETSPYWRALTPLEKSADLSAIDQGIDQGKVDLMETLRPIVERQIARLLEIGKRKVARGETVNVASLDVPYAKELRAAIEGAMVEHYKRGQAQVAKEAAKQKKVANLAQPIFNLTPEEIIKIFGSRADALTAVLDTKLKAQFGLQLTKFTGAAQDLAGPKEQQFIDDLLKFSMRDIRAMSPTVVIDSVNIGRASQAHSMGAQSAQFSAILDSGTCDPCGSSDGDEYEVGSDDYEQHLPPYIDCEGGDSCRCLYIYDFLA